MCIPSYYSITVGDEVQMFGAHFNLCFTINFIHLKKINVSGLVKHLSCGLGEQVLSAGAVYVY